MAINLRRFLRRDVNVYFMRNYTDDPLMVDMDIAAIYRTQSNVRSVVSFLADNIAELPLKVYRRESDNDRQRVTTGPVAETFARPNRAMTKFELIRATMSGLLLYDRVYWLISPDKDGRMEIIPIPRSWVIDHKGGDMLTPDTIVVQRGSEAVEIPSSLFVIFHGYDPESIAFGTSPIKALRTTLTEQIEADRYRLSVWKNGGRISSYISRPADVKPWTPEQAERFKEDFRAAWTGHGARTGGMPVLEDGMSIQSTSFNAKEAQWAEAKQISREEAAAIWHVNPSLIWHTGTQTYASAKDNARALYTETMGPYMEFLTERINAFVLPMLGATPDEYVEFDLMKKLAGSFEEQASVLTSSVGGPWMTRDEARARFNLPAVDGGSELIVPLNVVVGGSGYTDQYQNAALPETKAEEPETKEKREPVRIKAHPTEEVQDEYVSIMRKFMERQARTVLSAMGGKSKDDPSWWNADRWNRELADDLYKHATETTASQAIATLRQSGIPDVYDPDKVEAYLRAMCDGRAKDVNQRTLQELLAALEDAEDEDRLERAATVLNAADTRAERSGRSMASAIIGFAVLEAVRQAASAGYSVQGATKTWVVTSGNPRPSHAAMDGETVGYNDHFSNGADWPGDSSVLDAADVVNCQCEVEIVIP